MSIIDIKAGLRAYILSDAAISAIVGGSRVYSMLLPQSQTQASVVFTKISGQGDYHMRGSSGLSRPRMQIDCYSLDADVATSLANLVKDRIEGFRGSFLWGVASPQSGVEVLSIFFDNERELYEADTKLFRISRDYLIWYREF